VAVTGTQPNTTVTTSSSALPLNDDLDNAEWGYFSLAELKDINIHCMEIDHDLYWKPTPAGEIERIKDYL